MQLHIVGSDSLPDSLQAKQELAIVFEFLGINIVVEERFSGLPGSGVVLVPPAETSGIDLSCPVLVLDVDGEVATQFAEFEATGRKVPGIWNDVQPLGIIQRPLSLESLSASLRAVRARHTLHLAPQTRELPALQARIVAEVPGEHEILDSLRVGIASTARQDGCVLITGETGTGKRKVAEAIYQCSDYADGPFVPVSCATFPEALLAIELFGCESGALPGTNSRRIGRIEMAEGGVLLLEDVEALSIQSQASLLAFLRSKRLERVGSTRGAPCEVRLIASTTVDLERLVERGEFREDLFYALQGLVVNVPPLREYITALPGLLQEMDAVFQTGAFTNQAWDALARYSWPGNVKELQNFAQQMAPQVEDGVFDAKDLPARILGDAPAPAVETDEPGNAQANVLLPVNGLELKPYLATLEKNLITQALEDTGFVVARAADRLHIRRTTLVEKMRKYGLQRG